MYTGPHLIKDNLVFGYDTGYGVNNTATNSRFYQGKPATNLASGLIKTFSNWSGLSGSTEYYTRNGSQGVHLIVTSGGGVQWHASTQINNVSASTLYTVSATVKWTGITPHTNLFYIREYNSSGTQVREGGKFSTSFMIDLGDGWYRAYRTFTTTSTTDYLRIQGYQYTAGINIYYQDEQFELGSQLTPYSGDNFVRSSTQSLIDLKRTTDIDVANVSFDSTGQPTFDGTDDSLTIPGSTDTTSDAKTIEIAFKMNGSYSNFSPLAIYANGSSSTNRIWLGLQNNKFRMHGWGTDDPDGTTTILSDEWYICTFSYNKSTQAMKIYTNGVLESSTTNSQGGVTASSNMNWYLGTIPGGWQSVTYSDVDIPIFKVHSRILSDSEVKQNYRAYKNRFGI